MNFFFELIQNRKLSQDSDLTKVILSKIQKQLTDKNEKISREKTEIET